MVATSITVVIVWLFWPSVSQHQVTETKATIEKPMIKAEPSQVIAVKSSSNVAVTSSRITSNDSATLVAKAYAGELNFPPYSQPLSSNDFDRLNPNYFNPQSIPVDDDGTVVTAELSKYRYTYPESIVATLSGIDIERAQLQLIDISNGKTLLTKSFEQDDNTWQTQLAGERDFPQQLQATVKADINGKRVNIALSLKYIDSVATLESFDSAVTHEADMLIQANLKTREKGLYRVRANLLDENQDPIAHLVSKKKLSKGNTSIDLKAHQSVLQGKQQPFYLSTFSIELMSPAPGKPTKYGDSVINQYEIKDFAISGLSDLPYQPTTQEQQRLLLLQNMAQGN